MENPDKYLNAAMLAKKNGDMQAYEYLIGQYYKASEEQADPLRDSGFLDKSLIIAGHVGQSAFDGVRQPLVNAAAKVGIADEETAQRLNREITQNDEQFYKDFADEPGFLAADIAGQIGAGAYPVAKLSKLKRIHDIYSKMEKLAKIDRSARWIRNGIKGAVAGMAGAATQKAYTNEEGSDYWASKAAQLGLGAGAGLALGAATGAAYQAMLNRAVKEKEPGIFARWLLGLDEKNQKVRARRAAIEERSGLQLFTEGQRSASRSLRGIEENLRKTPGLEDDIFYKGDLELRKNIEKWVARKAEQLSKENLDEISLGRKVQETTKELWGKLRDERHNITEPLYAKIAKDLGDSRIVPMRNTLNTLDELERDFGGKFSNEARKIKGEIGRIRETLLASADENGVVPFRDAWDLKKATSDKNARLLKIDNFKADSAVKARLKHAVIQDMEESGQLMRQAGLNDYADMLKEADTTWRVYSDKIRSLENSVLGKSMGQELAGSISDAMQNTKPPEVFIDNLLKAKPSQAKAAMEFLDKRAPYLADEIRARLLRNVVQYGYEQADTGEKILSGARALQQLGVTAGKGSGQARERLRAIFGKNEELDKFIDDLLETLDAHRDRWGLNTSNTQYQQEVSEKISDVTKMLDPNERISTKAFNLVGGKLKSAAMKKYGDELIAKKLYATPSENIKPVTLAKLIKPKETRQGLKLRKLIKSRKSPTLGAIAAQAKNQQKRKKRKKSNAYL